MRGIVQTTVTHRASGKRYTMNRSLRWDHWYFNFDLRNDRWYPTKSEAYRAAEMAGDLVEERP